MVVDDETDLRERLDLYLKKEGFETNTTEDGSDFLKKLDDFQPDLVTLDVMMPGLKTTEIFEKLKEKKQTKNPLAHCYPLYGWRKTKGMSDGEHR